MTSFLSNGHSEVSQSASIKSLQDLLTFLSEHGKDILNNQQLLSEFETVTATTLLEHEDPELLKILRDCGWTGYRFLESNERPLDVDYCKQALSNYYLKASSTGRKLVSQTSFTRSASAHGSDSKNTNMAEHILPLCPDMLIQALELNKFVLTDPCCIYFWGACVLADMSGFSKFSGEMCSKGIEGLDELRATTSGFLGDLVNTIYKYGGDGKHFYYVILKKKKMIVALILPFFRSNCICW